MKFQILFTALLALPLAVQAEEKDPRPEMHGMAQEVSALQKYLLSDAEFGAAGNEQSIQKLIGALQGHLDGLGKGKFSDDPALKVNLSLLQQHVNDADRAFREGSKPFSRYMLQSSLQMCIACHTRKKTADFSWPEPDTKDVAPIDRADYFFATRQFQKGKEIYENIVSQYPGNKVGQWVLHRALLALAVYYSRVSEDPANGAAYFAAVGKQEGFPIYMKEESAAWAKEFQVWAKERKGKPEKATEMELLAQARKLLRHDDFTLVSEIGRSFHVRRLRASALLHRVLEAPGAKSPTKGQALLLLGQIYPRISSSLFFRFGDMYLKACITDYPKSATAKQCYVALERIVAEGYTGSGGTNIPSDEEVELMRLKRLAY